MMVLSLFIIDLMGLFFYTKIGSIISIGDLPTTNIIEPEFSQLKSQRQKTLAFAILVLLISTIMFSLRIILKCDLTRVNWK